MRLLLTALLVASPALAEPPALAHPESIVMAQDTGFVSNIGAALDPGAADRDGFIARIGADGTPIGGPAIPQPGAVLDAPKGLALLDGRLYVADIDRVVAFDPASGNQIAEFRPQGAIGLNDLAVAGDHLLVTDFDAGSLLSLDPASGVFTTVATGIEGANGVIADGGTAYVVASGAKFEGGGITRIDLASGQTSPVGDVRGILDGVVLSKDGALIVTDWVDLSRPTPGRILMIDPASGAAVPVRTPPLTGPADLARAGDRLMVPVMLENRIATIPAP